MKEVNTFIPFWNFQDDGDFIGYYKSFKTVNDSTVGLFETGGGEEFLIGGKQIGRLIESDKFKVGKKYLIRFLGQQMYKNRKFNSFKVFEYEENDPEAES